MWKLRMLFHDISRESFYRNPETVLVASKWVNTDLIENRFLLKYNDRE